MAPLFVLLLSITPQIAFIVALSGVAVAVVTVGWNFYTSHAYRMKILRLQNENLLLSVGKRKILSYREIVAMYDLFAKNNSKEKLAEFSKLVTFRVVEEVESIRSYTELRQYMQGYEQLVSPMLLMVHQNVIASCKLHVGELFSAELASIKNMAGGHQAQLRSIEIFISELSSSCFEHFQYQPGNKKAAEKFRNELVRFIEEKEEAPVHYIDTSSLKEKKAK